MRMDTLAALRRRLMGVTLLVGLSALPVALPAEAEESVGSAGAPARDELRDAALAMFAPGPGHGEVEAAGSGTFSDPAGDTTRYDECHADIRSFAAAYEWPVIDVSVATGCGSNPYLDANWSPGVSSIMFAFDTDLDGVPDHAAFYFHDGERLLGEVVRFGPLGDTITCSGLVPSWDGGRTYGLRIESDCIGRPMSFRYGVLASWDADPDASGCLCSIDGAPDGELTAPIYAPVVPSPLGDGPGVASAGNGAVVVFARGLDDGLWMRRSDDGSWGGWTTLGGAITSAPGVASNGTGIIDVFVRGADDALWTRRFNGTRWTRWRTLGGALSSAPVAVPSTDGTIDVFAQGADGAVWTRRRNGAVWSSWSTLGGLVEGAPTAVSSAPGQLVVFARGGDNALWAQTFDGTEWGTWVSLGGLMTSSPAAISTGPAQLEVFARGGDNALWTRRSDTGLWTAWTSLGGDLTSAPAAVSAEEGQVDVFARGADTALWTRHRSGTWAPWTSLGGSIR